MGKLRDLLQGLNVWGPEIIVFIGEFLSPEGRSQGFMRFKECFDNLISLMKELNCDAIMKESSWYFIPSLNDSAICKLMPTFKLPDYLLGALKG